VHPWLYFSDGALDSRTIVDTCLAWSGMFYSLSINRNDEELNNSAYQHLIESRHSKAPDAAQPMG